MAIQLKSSGDVAVQQVRLLVYGQAGAGKTSLIPTLPAPVILSAEAGLLSIAGSNLPFVEINSVENAAGGLPVAHRVQRGRAV